MHLASPIALLLALPVFGALILLYILKLRRTDVIVSSTFLWRQVIRDVQANAPFQKLRRNLLLLLQLLAAALIILMLAAPFFRTMETGGRSMVLVIDTGASMAATDVPGGRLQAAKQEAQKLVDGLRAGDMMMVLSAWARPDSVTGFTSDRSQLLEAIEGLQPHATPVRMQDALREAADLAASRSGTNEIDIISDGVFQGEPGAGSMLSGVHLGQTRVLFHPVGSGRENVGIIAVSARPNPGSPPTDQLLVVTHNYGFKERKFTEEIAAGDNLLEAQDVTLGPGQESTAPYDLPMPARPVELTVRLDLKDQLAADNQAALILRPQQNVKVLEIGPPNYFLDDALQVDPETTVYRSASFPGAAALKPYDVVVFYGAAPRTLPPGNYLFIHCTSDRCPAQVTGSTSNVAVVDWERNDPVLRYVDLGSQEFARAMSASPKPWARELASGDSGSLVVAGEQPGSRSIFVAFDPMESRFPFAVGFPIFISNAVRWLGLGAADADLDNVATGEPVTIPSPAGIGRVTVTRPDGHVEMVAAGPQGGALFAGTDEVGVYRASAPGFTYPFSANLSDPGISDIAPEPRVPLPPAPAASPGRRIAVSHSLIEPLALLALAILLLEWWAYHRRVFVNA